MKLSSNTSSFSFQTIVAVCFGVFLVISSGSSCAQAQELIFSDVGAGDGDQLGFDVSISGDGMYMAAGTFYGDPNGLRHAGYARLYARSGTDWNMIQQINGTRIDGQFGWTLDLSHDGSMLAIGSRHGAIFMYELSPSSFLYRVLHIINNVFPAEVSVSGDGKVVGYTVFGGQRKTKIFERIGNGFQQRGADLPDNYRGGIALNYNGSIAIVGDYQWPSVSFNNGRAAVFQWKDNNEDGSMQWIQMGSDITGDAAQDYLGYDKSVSITYDGLTVAVTAWGFDSGGLLGTGLVRVYNYDLTSDSWKQSGIDLVGDINEEFSETLSYTAISSDGTYLAVGGFGFVKLFAKNGTNYEPVGERIIGEIGGIGGVVDISADGSALVVSDSFRDIVYLYDTTKPPAPSSLPPSMSPMSIAPTVSSSLPQSSSPMSNAKSIFICMMLSWMV